MVDTQPVLLTIVSTVSTAQPGVLGPVEATVAGGPGCSRPDLSQFLESIGIRGINSFGYQQCETPNLGEDLRPQTHYLD